MSTALQLTGQYKDDYHLDIVTVQSDSTRATLRARGTLDSANAPLLAEVLAGHVRSRRRFLRLDVSELSITDTDAVSVIVQAHQALLAVRGTLILTGVSDPVGTMLAGAGVDRQLFLIRQMASELIGPND
ncbi:MAG: STAS domain-containing protein [Jatrophihabitantaceae bacterium]